MGCMWMTQHRARRRESNGRQGRKEWWRERDKAEESENGRRGRARGEVAARPRTVVEREYREKGRG